MAESNTTICNQALSMLGAKRINNFDDATDTKLEAIQCRLHFVPTRDALIRSFRWRFASGRESLSQDTNSPDFEYDNQFILPSDFLALRSIFGDNGIEAENTRYSFAIEGDRILTDDDSVDLRYTKRVTDASKFDPLFVQLLVVQLADKLNGPLTGGDKGIQDKIDRRIISLTKSARAMDRQETNTVGRVSRRPWVEARLTNRSVRTSEGRVIG